MAHIQTHVPSAASPSCCQQCEESELHGALQSYTKITLPDTAHSYFLATSITEWFLKHCSILGLDNNFALPGQRNRNIPRRDCPRYFPQTWEGPEDVFCLFPTLHGKVRDPYLLPSQMTSSLSLCSLRGEEYNCLYGSDSRSNAILRLANAL